MDVCVCCVQPGETEGNLVGKIAGGGPLSEQGQQVCTCVEYVSHFTFAPAGLLLYLQIMTG